MQLPSIQNSQANSELKLQGSQIQTQKKKNKFDSENESFKENKSQASRKQVEKKHFETSTESISFQDGTTPRNFNHDEQLENRLIIDSAQKMTKSECKPAKKEFFFDEQRNNLSYKVPGMNRSLIQQTNQSGPDNQQQNQFQHMYNGSESLNARDRNRKQISKGNLRNSLQDININQNTNFQGNKLNNLIPINNQFAQFIQGNYEKNIKNDNIFSRQNQYQYQNQNQLKAKLLENQSYGQIKSTPDLSLIKLPISKLQKVESKEIKRRINIKVEQQFLN